MLLFNWYILALYILLMHAVKYFMLACMLACFNQSLSQSYITRCRPDGT